MCKCKEEDYKYEDYIDEYSGIPVYERKSTVKEERHMDNQLQFDFDSERCPAYDK